MGIDREVFQWRLLFHQVLCKVDYDPLNKNELHLLKIKVNNKVKNKQMNDLEGKSYMLCIWNETH